MNRAAIADLRQAAGNDHLLTAAGDTWSYGYDNSREHQPPGAVVMAQNSEQVAAVVKVCAQHHLTITPRGSGTATTGAAVPSRGGVVVSFEQMRRILAIRPADRLAMVEPGVTGEQLDQAAAEHDLFWPPDPTSRNIATVGGNLALNAGGPRAVKYGACRENILGLTFVSGVGDIIRTGSATTKHAVGFDLARLLVGSEGTLGLITQATLRLTPLPAAHALVRILFDDAVAALQSVGQIMSVMTPAACEFMDARAISLIMEQGLALPDEARAMLLVRLEADDQTSVDRQLRKLRQASDGKHCIELHRAADAREQADLWSARKALSAAQRTVASGKINEDVVVPVTRLPELMQLVIDLGQEHATDFVTFGHAGNGNLHVNALFDADDGAARERAKAAVSKLFPAVVQLDGALSGEHGIGTAKLAFVNLEIQPAALDLMRSVKKAFDPHGILNPGKLFPE